VAEVLAPITGNVWQVLVAAGDTVAEGDVVVILESMKLEIPVESDAAGTVQEVLVAEGDAVGEDDVLLVLA
jgi:acetyl-CoA carboxylase biotin carboxyl carrier protein